MRSSAPIAVLLSLTGLACESRPAEEEAAPNPETISAAAPVARVVIEQPAEGAEVQRNVTIVLGTENIRLAPAGDTASGTGHHHLFVNATITDPGQPIPAGVNNVIHLGRAQTSHELTNLPPGEYTVIAVLGDLVHRRIDPQVTDTVRFRVK
jgi:hypothetical protein